MDGRRTTVSTLNRLIEACKDGEKGYKAAAAEVKNGALGAMFSDYSQQRSRMALELEEAAQRLVNGSAEAEPFTAEDEASAISERERGENAVIREYEQALEQEDLPPDVKALVEKHYLQVRVAYDRIRAMEQAHQA